MKVFELRDDWGLENLQLSTRPDPTPEPGQVILRMRASSLNYRDLVVLNGGYGRAVGELPIIPVSDGVGEVVEVGDGVTRVKVGDRVCPTFNQNWIGGAPQKENFGLSLGGRLDGTLAEYMQLSQEGVVRVPDYLSDGEASTLPCAALTAWSALVTLGQVKAGDKILVQGSGSVALFALAFAKLHGAHVTAISSSDSKIARLKELGADEAINYETEPEWHKATRDITADRGGFDNIIELGGEKTLAKSIGAVRPGGTISSIGVLSGIKLEASIGPIVARQIKLQGVTVGSRNGFEAMLKAMELHGIRPVLDSCFSFEDSLDALHQIGGAGRFGKTWIEH